MTKNDVYPPMSVDEAYEYYWQVYEKGIYSLIQLQIKHRKGEEARSIWESYKKKDRYAARNFASYENMQKALKMVIREINQSRLCLSPVPQSTDTMDLEMEKKKIEIAHRTLLSSAKKSILGCGDSYYHNIRAYLINRIEQASNYKFVVKFDDENVVQLLDREEYLKQIKCSF